MRQIPRSLTLFFQAEDGIRDLYVTGVQTCALPISLHRYFTNAPADTGGDSSKFLAMNLSMEQQIAETVAVCDLVRGHKRSEERRVGKECRSRWWPVQCN